jgi:hypothetical protein
MLFVILIVNHTLHFNAWNDNIPNIQALIAVRICTGETLILEGVPLEILRSDLTNNLSMLRR